VRDVPITIVVIILEYGLNHCIYMFFYCLWVRWWTGAGRPFRKKYRLCRRTLGLEHNRILIHQRSNGCKPEVLNWRYMKLHTYMAFYFINPYKLLGFGYETRLQDLTNISSYT
jgi:hypothetical protein